MKRRYALLVASLLAANLYSCELLAGEGTVRDDSLLQAAVKFYGDGAYERAIDVLQSSAGPVRSAKANYYIGASFAALNDPQNAVRYLRSAVDSAADSVPYRFQLAKSLGVFGAVADAAREYRVILARDSTFLPALMNLGTLDFDGRDFSGAAEMFARAVRYNPRDYLAYHNLGASLVNLGKPDSAVQYLHLSMTLNLRYVPTLNLLASLYYKRKEYQDSGRLYGMIVARDSGNADAWGRWGYCFEKLKESGRAAWCFSRASRLDTANSAWLAHLGQAYFELKKFDSAAASYLRAASMEADNPVPYLNAGLSFASMDSAEAALDAFHRSFAEYHIERLSLLYSQIGGVYYKQKRFGPAEKSYLKALQYDPGNKRAMFFLAHSQEELRKFGAAASSYRRFLTLAGGDATQADVVPYARKRLRELTRGK